jgi:hypothetical protein
MTAVSSHSDSPVARRLQDQREIDGLRRDLSKSDHAIEREIALAQLDSLQRLSTNVDLGGKLFLSQMHEAAHQAHQPS